MKTGRFHPTARRSATESCGGREGREILHLFVLGKAEKLPTPFGSRSFSGGVRMAGGGRVVLSSSIPRMFCDVDVAYIQGYNDVDVDDGSDAMVDPTPAERLLDGGPDS